MEGELLSMNIISKMKFAFILLSIAAIGFCAFQGYTKFVVKPKVAQAKPIEDYTVGISNEDFGKAQKIASLFGYKNKYSYKYPAKKVLFTLKIEEDDNFIVKNGKKLANKAIKEVAGKSIIFDVNSITMLGYDKSNYKQEDYKYNTKNKTLYVHTPHLQMINSINYVNHQLDEGILTYLFNRMSMEDIERFHRDAEIKVENKYLNEKEIALAYKQTNEEYEKELLKTDFSFVVEKVEFINDHSSIEEVEIINEELRTEEMESK